MQQISLHNGQSIPAIGFGTAAIGAWQQDDEHVVTTVRKAIEVGYRHIDTASIYGNEQSVGKAIADSGVPREEFFLVTKVWDTQQGKGSTRKALEESLARLQTDYVDLYLVHWPMPTVTQDTWQDMEALHDEGKIRALGLSNFRQSDIEQLLTFARIKPVYNQLELHPYLTQQALTEYCAEQNIAVSCWSPLGSGSWSGVEADDKPIKDAVIEKIAAKHGVNTGQVILKWDVQQGRIVIPKAESEQHMLGNLQLDQFELTPDELAAIDALNRDHRFGADPDHATAQNLKMNVPD